MMSSDEIVFGDVTYREPRRKCRPDRDRQWACVAYELPGAADLPIYLDLPTADAIERHALRDTSVELGGILLGLECLDDQTGQPFVWVTQSLEAKHYENTQASFTYTHDSWEEITRERDRQYPDLDIVGWYHTHPDFGIFLSSHDLFIHQNFFAQPLQVAYVVDPIRQTRGFFQWRSNALDQVGGYYLTAERDSRLALARFVNDLENIPNSGAAGGAGGGLSPRLEAELIAMLTRPAYAPAAASDRGQTAAIFSLLGAVLGVLGLSAALWLNSLGQEVREQHEAIARLQTSVEKSNTTHKLEVDDARVHAKEAALDGLLSEVRSGASPERFTALYSEALQQLEDARGELKKQQVSGKAVFKDNERLESELGAQKKQAKLLEERARDADKLREDVRTLSDQLAARDNEQVVFKKYTYAWYTAVVASALCVFLSLGLLAVWAQAHPATAEETPGEGPHTIT